MEITIMMIKSRVIFSVVVRGGGFYIERKHIIIKFRILFETFPLNYG